MKKIILSFFLLLYIFSFTYWYDYDDGINITSWEERENKWSRQKIQQAKNANNQYINVSTDKSHQKLADKVAKDIVKAIDKDQIDLNNLDTVRDKVNSSIVAHWGWEWNAVVSWTEHYNSLARIEDWYLIIWCGNCDLAKIPLPKDRVQIVDKPTGDSRDTPRDIFRPTGGPAPVLPPPPPAPVLPPDPVVTTTTETRGWGCSSYISHWVQARWTCNIVWNWNNAWQISCRQENPWAPVSQWCGYTQCETTQTCVWEECTSTTSCWCNTSGCPGDAPRPATVIDMITVTADLRNPTSNCWDLYANNEDSCQLSVNITWRPHQWQPIIWLNGMWVSWFANKTNFRAKRVDNSWENALNWKGLSSSGIQWWWTSFSFTITGIKAYAPFVTTNGELWVKLNWVENIITGVRYKFNKIFYWWLDVVDGEDKVEKFRIWAQIILKLLVTKHTWQVSNYSISRYKESLKLTPSSEYVLQNVTNERELTRYPKVDFTVNYKWKTKIWEVQVSTLPVISYNIWGVDVNYYLSDKLDIERNDEIVLWTGKFAPIRIIWMFQWQWKQYLTLQDMNNSSISKVNLKDTITQNATKLIRWMEDWGISNKVKYMIWDVNYSSIKEDVLRGRIETLIVRNWNFVIDEDVLSIWNKLWIIVIKDSNNNYGLGDERSLRMWNILINPNVRQINAIMYADGWVMSADETGKVIKVNDSARTTKLNKQLIIRGTIFSKNTIWWAILWETGKYNLPWMSQTDNLDVAIMYDLNYLRRSNVWCDKNGNDKCTDNWEYEEPLVIIFNSVINSNPPKWFEGK